MDRGGGHQGQTRRVQLKKDTDDDETRRNRPPGRLTDDVGLIDLPGCLLAYLVRLDVDLVGRQSVEHSIPCMTIASIISTMVVVLSHPIHSAQEYRTQPTSERSPINQRWYERWLFLTINPRMVFTCCDFT